MWKVFFGSTDRNSPRCLPAATGQVGYGRAASYCTVCGGMNMSQKPHKSLHRGKGWLHLRTESLITFLWIFIYFCPASIKHTCAKMFKLKLNLLKGHIFELGIWGVFEAICCGQRIKLFRYEMSDWPWWWLLSFQSAQSQGLSPTVQLGILKEQNIGVARSFVMLTKRALAAWAAFSLRHQIVIYGQADYPSPLLP